MQESDTLTAAIEAAVEEKLGEEVRVSSYEQGGVVDVHVQVPGLQSAIESRTAEDPGVSVYSDLKFTVTQK